jgi:hypothetical protein
MVTVRRVINAILFVLNAMDYLKIIVFRVILHYLEKFQEKNALVLIVRKNYYLKNLLKHL